MQIAADHVGLAAQARAAREHVLNRALNERLRARLDDGRASPLLLVCECGGDGCAETVELARGEYAAARSHPRLYVVAPGHDSPGVTQTVVTVGGRFALVELLQSASTAVAALDGRAALAETAM